MLIFSVGFLFAPTFAAKAETFPNYIISDKEMTDSSAMNLLQLQNFLMRKGVLAGYIAPDTDGIVKTAAEIIWRVSRDFSISPKFLLALIQREQSLIEDPSPTLKQYDWATGFGVCDACSKDAPDVVVWKGFAKQVESAAKQIRNRYLSDIETKGTTVSGIGPGVTKQIDGTPVTPINKATAILFTYTPHLHGNQNFFTIWKRWFSIQHPDNTLVQVKGSKDIWLLLGGERRKFASKAIFRSRFSESDVIPISQTDLEFYPEAAEIKHPNYSLVRSGDGAIYLLDGDKKRHIVSNEVFRKLGYNPEEVEDALYTELAVYGDGAEISVESSYPLGALLQDKKTGGVYWAQDGIKHPIWGRDILNERFLKKAIKLANQDELSALVTGEPVLFSDGALVGVKGQPEVFVIEHGKRRLIPSEEVFNKFGWNWKNIIWSDQKIVYMHALGEDVQVTDGTVETAASVNTSVNEKSL